MKTTEQNNPVLNTSQVEEKPNELERALQLTKDLQSTQDVNELIDIVSKDIARLTKHQSISYIYPDLSTCYEVGDSAEHRCSFQLKVSGYALGVLEISRDRQFSTAEIPLVEMLLSALVYPLRNALVYHNLLNVVHKKVVNGVEVENEVINSGITRSTLYESNLSLLAVDIGLWPRKSL